MEKKHTTEYAILRAIEESKKLEEELTNFEMNLYIAGYMRAIQETAAPELLEALIECQKHLDKHPFDNIDLQDLVNNAIKKATE